MRTSARGIVVAVCLGGAVCARGVDPPAGAFDVDSLNFRIEQASVAEATWPRTPGGLAGVLFGQRAMVLPRESVRPAPQEPWSRSHIVFPGSDPADPSAETWFEASIRKAVDQTWRVAALDPCDEARSAEARAELERRRQNLLEICGFDFYSQGPRELLAVLKSRSWPMVVPPTVPVGWVREADLEVLVGLLDSTESCAGVINMLSSRLDSTRSTVGDQAAYLIDGFRAGRYPSVLLTTDPHGDIEGIKRWWRDRSGP